MRKVLPLNYQWNFVADYKDNYPTTNLTGLEVDIPHTVKLVEYNCFNEKDYQSVYTYQKTLTIPQEDLDKTLIINFEAVAHYAKVYCNGTVVAEHYGGYTAFTADITSVAVVGNNNITVLVDTTENSDIPPFSGVIDYLCFGGIYREVQLLVLDHCHISSLLVDGDMNGRLNVNTTVANYNDQPIQYTLCDSSDEVVHQWTALAGKCTELIDNVSLWSIHSPQLYTLTATVGNDSYTTRFGFRTCMFTNKGFYLNGQPTKLLGLNRHQSYPYVGYAMPSLMQIQDANILKASGCNIARHSHYPQSRHFLNRCDEVGLLCFVEAPGWQSIGQEAFHTNYLLSVEEMITEHYNHPSIIIWGVRVNESNDCDKLYTASNQLARQLDSTRQTTGVRYIKKSHLLEDVYSYNDFVHTGNNRGISRKSTVCGNVPYLITEHNGHMHPTKPYDSIHKRLSQVTRHAKVIDDTYGNRKVCGVIGWCLADYNTHIEFGSGDRICYHGVTDMFRQPKLAHSLYASQQEDVPVLELLSTADKGDYDAMIRKNIVIASNCDYIKVFNNGIYVNTFYPDRRHYPNMPHPIYNIPHLLYGEVERLYGYSAKDGKAILRALLCGVNGMQATDILPMLAVLIKHKKPMSYWQAMAMKVVMRNGCDDNYTFVGYVDDKEVITKKYGRSTSWHMQMSTSTTSVTLGDTYQIVQVDVSVLDNNDRVATYCNDVITITTDNGIIIGGSQHALVGGYASFYIRVDQDTTITASSDRWQPQQLTINVE